jgi:hypothetical protein
MIINHLACLCIREQVQQELPTRIAPLEACKATEIGEFWFDEEMGKFLKICGDGCSKISILPLFQVRHSFFFSTCCM